MRATKSGCCDLCESASADVCYCPIEGVIEVVSRKYALPIIALVGNHKSLRFTEIHSHFPRLSTKTLSDRLSEFQKVGFVKRTAFSEIPPRVEYSLTASGVEFRRLIKPLMEWAAKV